jgi:hypothetical protein
VTLSGRVFGLLSLVGSVPRRRYVIEQQAYANAGDGIESIDLLCSGFHAERNTDRS